jgi:Ca2+-binding EF-hand superfamily protein
LQHCDVRMSALDIAAMMVELDEDGDGVVSFQEFEK